MAKSTSSAASMQGDYSQFEYETCESKPDQQETEFQSQDVGHKSSSFWELVVSLYIPVLLMWLRRSISGTANLVHSLVFGQFLGYVSGNVSERMTEWTPPWLHSLIQPSNSKLDPHAWPPPGLTILALLTIFALVVHPDGFTWVMLGKIR